MTDQTPQPWEHIVEHAIEEAGFSPCRSKRGVVIFDAIDGNVVARGHNRKPECDGSAACKATCRVDAVHAEQCALLFAGCRARGADMLHVKAVDGALVVSGGPSCVECSKLARQAGIAGVWLYHADGWRRYPIGEFHALSVAAHAADAARIAELESENKELRRALRVLRKGLTADADGEFWSARRFLDERGVYHGDINGERVLEEVAKVALKKSAAPAVSSPEEP